MTNLPTLEETAQSPGVALTLELDGLAALLDAAEDAKKRADFVKKVVTAEVERRYGGAIAGQYTAHGKDTGTVRVTADGFEIVADRAKKVEWDQVQLGNAWDRIAATGDKPDEYIETSYRVDERKYSAWPEHIRAVFAPARTVKPGSLSLKLAKLEAA